MRYNRMRDIGLTEEQIKANLVFTDAKVGDLMKVSAIDAREAKDWFGATPPDLTVIARSRADASKGSGADYLYTYLRSYYRDDTKATGWNNLAFPSVGMPHVLWELQGQQRAVFVDRRPARRQEDGARVQGLRAADAGQLSQAEYNSAVADLVAYLQWMGEPMQGERVRLGVWVLLFLAVLTVIAWRLNALLEETSSSIAAAHGRRFAGAVGAFGRPLRFVFQRNDPVPT
jgi:ubiquinol-cytochrome c reductase cytochrome c1 subunit